MKALIIGNSDGIGSAVTAALAARGDRVVGISRSASPMGPEGPRHEILDVTSPQLPEVIRRLVREEGDFDVCIYCVGIGSELKLPDLSNEARVLDVNLIGMVRTMEALVPDWLARGHGHFVGISSLADDIYAADAPSYSASKAGFSNYLLSMGLKLRRHNVHVTNIRFGFVNTKMARARFRPFTMTREEAAQHVLRCLDRRPLQLSVPKVIGTLAHVFRLTQSLRVWIS